MLTMLKLTESLNLSSSDNKVRVYGFLSDHLDEVWNEVEPILETAIPYCDGKYEISDIKNFIKSLEMQLWCGFDNTGLIAACVTQVIIYPRCKRLLISFMAGKRLDEMIEEQPILEFGKQMGCDKAEICGRKGWVRRLKSTPVPFEEISRILSLKL